MTRTLLSPLVGAHFRPPAKALLASLPAGTILLLDPEPSNQYDSHALGVWINPQEAIPQGSMIANGLEPILPEWGSDLAQLWAEPRVQLGYACAASNSKMLARNSAYRSNKQLLDAMASGPDWTATLAFGPGGEPLIRLDLGQEP